MKTRNSSQKKCQQVLDPAMPIQSVEKQQVQARKASSQQTENQKQANNRAGEQNKEAKSGKHSSENLCRIRRQRDGPSRIAEVIRHNVRRTGFQKLLTVLGKMQRLEKSSFLDEQEIANFKEWSVEYFNPIKVFVYARCYYEYSTRCSTTKVSGIGYESGKILMWKGIETKACSNSLRT
uniref:Uncharacterized protein n=1 Tax=Ditylenchus dipsaci TaxID=166011 RepID=A0A915CS94_9BILA